MTRPDAVHVLRLVPAAAVALAAVSAVTTPAHAGPTVSADLDLGTSTSTVYSGYGYTTSPLYLVGFTLRAGWRFDLGAAVWFLPEIGGSYAVEHFVLGAYEMPPAPSPRVARFFGGGRVGWSGALRPELRFEPSIYGHVGAGWYSAILRRKGRACARRRPLARPPDPAALHRRRAGGLRRRDRLAPATVSLLGAASARPAWVLRSVGELRRPRRLALLVNVRGFMSPLGRIRSWLHEIGT